MKKFQFTVYENLKECTDSLLFNSETTIATLEINEYCLCLEVQGAVRIIDTSTQEVYKTPSKFPQELKEYIKSGDAFIYPNDNYFMDNNNWFNWTFLKNNEAIDGDICEIQINNLTEGQLLDKMTEVLNYFKVNN